MKASFAAVAALAGAALAAPQATASSGASSSVSFSTIRPSATAPAGCSDSYNGQFQISVVNVSSSSTKRDLSKRSTALTVTLNDGILIDNLGRVGYIASNNQFQFDYGGQAGEIYTAGWSACSNGTLALGDSAIFYQCLSGTFYNLYDESTGNQCNEIYIDIVGASNAAASSTSGAASQISDGQVTASAVSTQAVSQITDGQVQASTSAQAVSQISDGQVQATTAAAVVSQISDGQVQATTSAAVVSQISDGQIQATTSAPGAVVSQISDGQIQATTAVSGIVSQISDGQIQASATNGTKPTSASATAVAYTGAAALPSLRAELFGLAAGVLALAAL